MTEISFGLSILSICLALFAIFLQMRDKARLEVVSVHPGICGSRKSNDSQWDHNVTSIEVIIENKGDRAAIDCEAVIVFPHIEALPLHQQTRNHIVDFKTRTFNIQPKSKIRVVGAWNFSSDGAINGTKHVMTPGEFIEKCTPLKIIVSQGIKKYKFDFSKETAREIFQKHQEQQYLTFLLQVVADFLLGKLYNPLI
ncbi:MAG: hypothetical protein AB1545_09290 [Thermodesulfobacteriota bacterium]